MQDWNEPADQLHGGLQDRQLGDTGVARWGGRDVGFALEAGRGIGHGKGCKNRGTYGETITNQQP